MTLSIRTLLGMILILLCCVPAHALNPSRSIAQYKHTRWTVDQGVPPDLSVLAAGQDGYLWIGGATGLFRFDGITFEMIPKQNSASSEGTITALLVTREGDVWVGYTTGRTAKYHSGVLKSVPMSDIMVMNIVQTRDGNIWAMTALGKIYRFDSGHWVEVGTRLGFPQVETVVMIAARDGTIYVSTGDFGIFCLRPGAPRFERTTDVSTAAAVTEDRMGNRWISDALGSRLMRIGQSGKQQPVGTNYPTPRAYRSTQTLFDRDGNLWGMTDEGIYRISRPSSERAVSAAEAKALVSRYRAKDGLTSDLVSNILEDREGNIWVATALGLDRFHDVDAIVEPALTNRALWSDVLLGASDGSVYVGERDAVYRIKPGGQPEAILRVKETLALCEGPDKSIWIVTGDRVIRLRADQTSSFRSPVSDEVVNDCAVDAKNQIWIAAVRRGIFRGAQEPWQQSLVPGNGEVPISALLRESSGKMLVLNKNLAFMDPPNPAQVVVYGGAEYNSIRTVFEAPGRLLFGGSSGLGEVVAGRVRLLSSARFPPLRDVSGIVQIGTGQTWASTRSGPVMMTTANMNRALSDPQAPLPMQTFDFRDGLTSFPTGDSIRSVVAGGDGRLWFAIGTGTVWIDPDHLVRNKLAPPVNISKFISDGKTTFDPKSVQLAAGNHNIEIDFSALSLTAQERVQVRYQLVGYDPDWVNPAMRRQAFYANLPPGHYVFRVIASNNDGVWNKNGAAVEFDIPPTFLQSKWFAALCIGGIGLLLWIGYRIRIGQLAGKMRERLEQRLAERERIARDLHDTLLQGFQGLILHFQSVANEIPASQRAHGLMNNALDNADKVLSDGRDSVRHLRTIGDADIAATLSDTAQRMSATYPVKFRLTVEGTPRPLHPVARTEILRIGEEAIINAFQHGQATLIEVALSYGAAELSLGIRDNGIGIDPKIVEDGGREGHFGLVGMQERADQINAAFSASSRAGAGTEIGLTVPGKVAYTARRQSSLRDWLGFPALAGNGL